MGFDQIRFPGAALSLAVPSSARHALVPRHEGTTLSLFLKLILFQALFAADRTGALRLCRSSPGLELDSRRKTFRKCDMGHYYSYKQVKPIARGRGARATVVKTVTCAQRLRLPDLLPASGVGEPPKRGVNPSDRNFRATRTVIQSYSKRRGDELLEAHTKGGRLHHRRRHGPVPKVCALRMCLYQSKKRVPTSPNGFCKTTAMRRERQWYYQRFKKVQSRERYMRWMYYER